MGICPLLVGMDAHLASPCDASSWRSILDTPCNCNALRQAARRVTQLYDRALAPLDLRATQYALLRAIERLGPIAMIPLAEATVMDRATLGHNVRPLLVRGYASLTVGRDRRSREVSLTDPGRKVLKKAQPLWQRAQEVFEREIGAQDAAQLRASVNRIATREFADD